MVDNIAVVDHGGAATRTNYGINTSSPRVVNSNIYNVDVTEKFKEAVAKLAPGTLIKDEHFTLFESVGALEIGDPKMDSGCNESENDTDTDFDVAQSLSPPEVLWLIEELFCREASWHMGYPLSQTLFSSYHIDSLLWPEPLQLCDAQFGRSLRSDEADPLVHLVLRAYCLALLKCCGLTLAMVTSQHYYEEEDFASQLFNRDLLQKFTVDGIFDIIHEAMTWLSTSTLDAETKTALLSHMQFRIDILEEFSQHTSTPPASRMVKPLNMDDIRFREVSRKSVDNAFSTRLQRRLASSVPPRPMVTINLGIAIDFWSCACRQMSDAFAVRSVCQCTDLLTSYLLFTAQDPPPATYVRALLQSFLSENERVYNRYNMTDLMWEDLECLTLASSHSLVMATGHEVPSDESSSHAIQSLKDFLFKIENSYTNVFRTLCLNRSRFRRTLCHAVIEWDQIQAEGEALDEQIQILVHESPSIHNPGSAPTFSYPLSSWVYHCKLMQVRLLVQMGFELSVYAPHEMAGMYWYLAHICDIHLSHLERISHFIAKTQRSIPTSRQLSSHEHTILQRCRTATNTLYRHFAQLKATEALARALHGLYLVINRSSQNSTPITIYSTNQLRYEIRMRPFLHLSVPEPVSFAQFEQLSLQRGKDNDTILNTASDYAQVAKRAWEEVSRMAWHAFPLSEASSDRPIVLERHWETDAHGALKASIGTNITIMELKKRLLPKQGESVDQQLDFKIPQRGDDHFWHPFWAAPQLL